VPSSDTTLFKSAAINHSAIPPSALSVAQAEQMVNAAQYLTD
jgi:hypothetical protein